MKLSTNGPLYGYLCAYELQLINIIDDITATIFYEKNESTVTATVLLWFFWNYEFE